MWNGERGFDTMSTFTFVVGCLLFTPGLLQDVHICILETVAISGAAGLYGTWCEYHWHRTTKLCIRSAGVTLNVDKGEEGCKKPRSFVGVLYGWRSTVEYLAVVTIASDQRILPNSALHSRQIFHGEILQWHPTVSVASQSRCCSTACKNIPMSCPSKVPLHLGKSGSPLIHDSFGPHKFVPKMASRSVQPFLQDLGSWPTDRSCCAKISAARGNISS